jgi:hypothetical protein
MVYEILIYWWHLILRWQSSGIWHHVVRGWVQWNISIMKPLRWQHCICVHQISSHWSMLTVSEWYLQKCTMREKDKLTIFTVLKSSEFFLCSLFIYYFLENAWWISLPSSTYSGKQKGKILLLLQQRVEIICYYDWKQLLQESVWDDCNIVICCTRNIIMSDNTLSWSKTWVRSSRYTVNCTALLTCE